MNPYAPPLTCDKPGPSPLGWLLIGSREAALFTLGSLPVLGAGVCMAMGVVILFPPALGFLSAVLLAWIVPPLRPDRIYVPMSWTFVAIGCLLVPVWWQCLATV